MVVDGVWRGKEEEKEGQKGFEELTRLLQLERAFWILYVCETVSIVV